MKIMLKHTVLPLLILAGPYLGAAAEPLRIGVSVLPLETLVREIGGDYVAVRSLQQEGDSCSIFEPRPSSITWLSSARIFFRIGVGYESAILPKLERQYSDLKVYDLRESLQADQLREGHAHHGPEAHDSAETLDPHIWLNPLYLAEMGTWVAQRLGQALPGHQQYFNERAKLYSERLAALDREISGLLAPYQGKGFFIYHPALSYFAERYHLHQVAIEESGQAPSAGELHQLIQRARAEGARTVFAQPQESTRQAELVAKAIGGKVVVIDPMGIALEENLLLIARSLAASFCSDES